MNATPHDTRESSPTDWLVDGTGRVTPILALVLVWSRDELERIGELALLPPIAGTHVLGRGGDLASGQVLTEPRQPNPHDRQATPGGHVIEGEVIGDAEYETRRWSSATDKPTTDAPTRQHRRTTTDSDC